MANTEFTEFELVRAIVQRFIAEKRALPAWEIASFTGFDQDRVEQLLDSPRLLRDMVDALGDGSFEAKPALMAKIVEAMQELQGDLGKSLLRTLLREFEKLDAETEED